LPGFSSNVKKKKGGGWRVHSAVEYQFSRSYVAGKKRLPVLNTKLYMLRRKGEREKKDSCGKDK